MPTLPVTVETYRDLAMAPRGSLQSRVKASTARYHGGERATDAITLIVMHSTADKGSAADAIAYLNRDGSPYPASYHYVIDRDGAIWRMCPASRVAYHAGNSWWPNPTPYPPGNITTDEDGSARTLSVNDHSVGIAWANANDGVERLTREQVESALYLCGLYVPTTAVKSALNIVAHRDVAPGRKSDPHPETMPMDVWRALVTLYLRGA